MSVHNSQFPHGYVTHPFNLEQLKKRAKDLKRSHGNNTATAALRIKRAVPRLKQYAIHEILSKPFKLTDAQFVIAREAGFASWPKLRQAMNIAEFDLVAVEEQVVKASLNGDFKLIDTIKAQHAEQMQRSLVCLLCSHDRDALALLTSENINQSFGPLGWPPLLYACASQQRESIKISEDLIAELIRLGADVNLGGLEHGTVRGYISPLGAAIGFSYSATMAQQLLDAGADVVDGPSLYEGGVFWMAVKHQNIECLKELLVRKPAQWQLCHALTHAMQFNDTEIIECLLKHGADPNWTKGTWGFDGTSLHEAVMLDVDERIVELLIEAGANTELTDRDGRTAYQLAACLGQKKYDTVFESDSQALRQCDHHIAQFFRGNSSIPFADLKGLTDADELWLCRAIRRGLSEAALAFISAGTPVNVQDDDGMTPLHLALEQGDITCIGKLLDAGADCSVPNFLNETAFDMAMRLDYSDQSLLLRLAGDEQQAVSDLNEPSFQEHFEVAVDAVVNGEADMLRGLLQAHPELVHARSSRLHRCTLFNYLGANGVEQERQITPSNALEIIDIMLDAGADPNATCYTYRGGPSETTLGLLTSSVHPRKAGLTMPMVSTIIDGGGVASPIYTLLAKLWKSVDLGALPPIEIDEAASSALVEASMMGEIKLVKALLELGVPVDGKSNFDQTALHWAAYSGDEPMVDLLLSFESDPSREESQFNANVAGWACAGGHPDLGERLKLIIQSEWPAT